MADHHPSPDISTGERMPWPGPPFPRALAWSRGGPSAPPPSSGSAGAFGAWALRTAWWAFGPRWTVAAWGVFAAIFLVSAVVIDATSSNEVSWSRVAGVTAGLATVAPYISRAACAGLIAAAAYLLVRSGSVLRTGAHFWADLLHVPHTPTTSTPSRRVARTFVFAPAAGFRLFIVATPFAVVAWAIGTAAPAASAAVLDTTWVWTVLASAGLALVFGLRGCGIRYRHPVDPGIGGGASIITAVVFSAALAACIVLGARPSGSWFTFAGLSIGGFVAGVIEALVRGPGGIGLRVARVPLGYERDLVFAPFSDDTDDNRWVIQVERRSPLDPLHRDSLSPTRTLLIRPGDARETFTCDPVDGTGVDAIARAIISAFWGIEHAHIGDVRRAARALLGPMAERESFRVPFAALIEVGVSVEPDVEAGLSPLWAPLSSALAR